MRILDLGLIAYADARTMQEQARQRVLDSGEESLFLLEHPPVITFGRNGGEENLPFDRNFFAARGVDIIASTRGGNITCHFPGQFVAYPIMRVDKRPGGLRRFFADLEEARLEQSHVLIDIPQEALGESGLWLRAEPDMSPAQARALADILIRGLTP